MKTRVLLFVLSFSFFSLTSYAVNDKKEKEIDEIKVDNSEYITLYGVYKGYNTSGYNFNIYAMNGSYSLFTFQKGDSRILRANRLQSSSTIGKTFEITFVNTGSEKRMKDAIWTIKGLQVLK